MQQAVDKHGASTLLRLNEVVRRRKNSSGDSSKATPSKTAAPPPPSTTTTTATTLESTAEAPSTPQQSPAQTTTPLAVHDQRVRFLVEFGAGALGGALGRTATAPVDRLRTVYQVQSVEAASRRAAAALSVGQLWRALVREGGWCGLWRGNLVNVVKTAPENAIRLAVYEKLKQSVRAHAGVQSNSFGERVACGSAAGLLATLALYPLKTVKTLMNLGARGEFRSIAHCVARVYATHGAAAFYRGLGANALAIIPSAGIDLACYETLKQAYGGARRTREPNVCEKLALGTVSSCVGNFVVYPLLFARTRLQANRSIGETTLGVLASVVRRDGLRGVYRGFLLHVLKIGPAASISYVTFETCTQTFHLKSLS